MTGFARSLSFSKVGSNGTRSQASGKCTWLFCSLPKTLSDCQFMLEDKLGSTHRLHGPGDDRNIQERRCLVD
jgi:hypothetical protein